VLSRRPLGVQPYSDVPVGSSVRGATVIEGLVKGVAYISSVYPLKDPSALMKTVPLTPALLLLIAYGFFSQGYLLFSVIREAQTAPCLFKLRNQ
jgi:hypothetical protein